MAELHISASAARAATIAAQGLHKRPAKATPRAVLDTIRRMGVLQIDTISVVNRSPYFVLWSRLGHYEPQWLDELLAQGHLFEYWAHEACFLPIEDFSLYRHRMLGAEDMGWRYNRAWAAQNREVMERTLAYVRENGPVRSADFRREDGQKGGWWEWKPEKRALETLFSAGELMIARRHNFHRVYDLRERILPDWDDNQLPTLEEVQKQLVLKAVHALGVAPARWIPDYFRTKKAATLPHLASLAEEGLLVRVQVEDQSGEAYIHPGNVALVRSAIAGKLKPSLTTLLSPFDPLVWHRERALSMFGFDYRIECYTPAPKRRYGYFVLPVLHGDALIGRLDAKAHRSTGIFEVKAWYTEPQTNFDEEAAIAVANAIRECAQWHGTPEVVFNKTGAGKPGAMIARAIGKE